MCAKDLRPKSRLAALERKDECLASYCSHLKRRNASPRTVETYVDCLLVFARWLDDAGIDSPAHATPADLEGFRLWLASERASGFVTGSIVRVDGGFTAMTI